MASFEIADFLESLNALDGVEESLVLATCNRFEIYLINSDDQNPSDGVLSILAQNRSLVADKLKSDCYVFEEGDAIRHLFRVACGIDSLILGEFEILSQLRKALQLSRGVGALGRQSERLFKRAITVGRRARSETNISRGNLSVASEAVTLAEEALGGLDGKTALVIGGGELGELTAKVLSNKKISTLMVSNRTQSSAQEIAEKLGCKAVSLETIIHDVLSSDLVVCATGAPHYILQKEMLSSSWGAKNTRRVFLDLSVPANIDPEIADLDDTTIFSIEDLRAKSLRNRTIREAEIVKVDRIVDEEACRFEDMEKRAHSKEITSELRREIEDIRRHYIQTHAHRFNEENRLYLNQFTKSLVNQILHKLTTNLQQLDPTTEEGRQTVEVAKVLFEIGQESATRCEDREKAE